MQNTGKNNTDRYTENSFGGKMPRQHTIEDQKSGTNRILSDAAKNTFSKPGSEIRMQMFSTSDNRTTNAASELGNNYGLNNIKSQNVKQMAKYNKNINYQSELKNHKMIPNTASPSKLGKAQLILPTQINSSSNNFQNSFRHE